METKSKELIYVIMTPPPNIKSAGITYLNEIGKNLRSIGKRVLNIYHIEPQGELYLWGADSIPETNHWATPWQGKWVKWYPGIFERIIGDTPSIFIHGENKHYKWFENFNVVRYYLAGISALQKKGVPREGEYKLAWDLSFCNEADFVLRKCMFRGDMASAEKKSIENRNLDLTYEGKAWIRSKFNPRLPETLELKRNWPEFDDEYFYLLSKTRFLYTYDHITSVVEDAVFLGALPVFLDESIKNNLSWMASINADLQGCFCFSGDDKASVLKDFDFHRKIFIEKSMLRNSMYTDNLKMFCIDVEKRFFETSKA
jgi:hypothetical protein